MSSKIDESINAAAPSEDLLTSVLSKAPHLPFTPADVQRVASKGVPSSHDEARARAVDAIGELILCGVRFIISMITKKKGA